MYTWTDTISKLDGKIFHSRVYGGVVTVDAKSRTLSCDDGRTIEINSPDDIRNLNLAYEDSEYWNRREVMLEKERQEATI